jgi:predicted DNA-binding transcriptional regulator AlpA
MDSPYLSVKEVTQLLGIRSTKWVYTHKSEIPGFFMLGKSIFFDKEVLLATLKAKATKPVKRISH